MASVRSHTQDISMSVDETMVTLSERSDPCTEHHHEIVEPESLSQPMANFLADEASTQEYSQAPASGAQVAPSQQPTPELLTSLGIKVRDFAYESTLPAIVPVPRVPRQVQPAPRALKRSQRDWDDEGFPDDSFQARPQARHAGFNKSRSLERKPTEPLQETAVQHTRALERITFKKVCSIIAPRRALPAIPRTRLPTSPLTSPLMPSLSHLASQGPEFVQTPSTFPFVVHVDDTSMVPGSQLDGEPHPLSLRSALYTRYTLDSGSPPGCSPAPSPPQNVSPAPLTAPFPELPSPVRESGADRHTRGRRVREAAGTTPSSRYQLRQRPTPSSRASTVSRFAHQPSSPSKSLSRRSRRVR